MGMPFCTKCGNLLALDPRNRKNSKIVCLNCGFENDIPDSQFTEKKEEIIHTVKDKTRIIDKGSPPIPKVMTQTYKEQKTKRCFHPKAIFKGFYQFSRGDEASRKYWFCPDCGQTFRFSGRAEVKERRKIIYEKPNKLVKKD